MLSSQGCVNDNADSTGHGQPGTSTENNEQNDIVDDLQNYDPEPDVPIFGEHFFDYN